MKHYRVGDVVISEEDILDEYWDFWYEKMVRDDKRKHISHYNCIQDWVVINQAEEMECGK